ncbi:hypothetical protein RND71_024658 [Anisodus tanguticus]|uniref:dolichyl-P-Man:Man5GlcNAc2-PP-dolichol alpha-1,3-mannosyltransferase n=1 Tax=Anisodus tanguticus TaxID=243964 RepID=A0AAE1V554_9SOLA|nr:hypothetical protein RND71_024658 [Anisodus tanguticus]
MSRGTRQASAIARHCQAMPLAQRVTLFKMQGFNNLSKYKNARSTCQASTMARRTQAMPLVQRVRMSKMQQLLKISKDGTTHISHQASDIARHGLAITLAQRVKLPAGINFASPNPFWTSWRILIGLPFILSHPASYISKAFNLGRVFIHFCRLWHAFQNNLTAENCNCTICATLTLCISLAEEMQGKTAYNRHLWSVNFKFVPEDIFVSKAFALSLLVAHLSLLLVFAHYRRCRHEGGLFAVVHSKIIQLKLRIAPRNPSPTNKVLQADRTSIAYHIYCGKQHFQPSYGIQFDTQTSLFASVVWYFLFWVFTSSSVVRQLTVVSSCRVLLECLPLQHLLISSPPLCPFDHIGQSMDKFTRISICRKNN